MRLVPGRRAPPPASSFSPRSPSSPLPPSSFSFSPSPLLLGRRYVLLQSVPQKPPCAAEGYGVVV
eukprot:4211458-Prymnesium_polylepis.1